MKGSYIGLGDSISIDAYPALDQGLKETSKVGASSRFGAWLLSMGYVDRDYYFATDGATISDVRKQLRKVPLDERHLPNVITLTAGGNDISFGAMGWQRSRRDEDAYPNLMSRVKDEYKDLCCEVRQIFPNSFVIVNTLYDPSDGKGSLSNCGSWSAIVDWYSRGRRELGRYIESRGPLPDEQFLVADLFNLFDGHGMSDSIWGSRWYYKDFMIEPGFTGARKIAIRWTYVLRKNPAFREYVQEELDLQETHI